MKNLAVMASGRGSHLQNIIKACTHKQLNAKVVVVITNHIACSAIKIAKGHNIPTYCLNDDVGITDTLCHYKTDWVILAGYLRKIGPLVLAQFLGHIVNIHPSLLPKYGGKGMYGMHVHRAVLAAGEDETGATVHKVNQRYDEGEILAQEKIFIQPGETSDSLAGRVLALEHPLYIKTLNKLCQ